jgi:hypothetical protein
MNIGRYLRGEDRHVGTARVSKEKQQKAVDIDPMNTPLPCDVKVGHVTIRKGVALRTLVMRMQVLYDMAQPKQEGEPVAEVKDNPYCPDGHSDEITEYLPVGMKLYITPPQRTWVGLTDEEMAEIVEEFDGVGWDIAPVIEAKLKEKNT